MKFLVRAWYDKAPWLWLLWPFSLFYRTVIYWRKRLHQAQAYRGEVPQVPIIVVGNITLGGTGKTPLVIALCEHLKRQGRHPGIISRGYGGSSNTYPLAVTKSTPASIAGDEAVLIAEKTCCPVVIDPDRRQAFDALMSWSEVEVVLSDDGLQHYRLSRYLQIMVVDGERLFGNELCLPAGPLREPLSRLLDMDYLVINEGRPILHHALQNAYTMKIMPVALTNLYTHQKCTFSEPPFREQATIQAVAALGNPQRFFATLESLPYPVKAFPFPDHYRFQASDFGSDKFDPDQPIVMTEKDAVKCREFVTTNMWSVDVEVDLPPNFLASIDLKLTKFDPLVEDFNRNR
ncbi:MAG: tetraacyldisaccharide 4'-kinase [Gammaproteobacteria bacterium]|nr:tetraacyldisaccharide 4'-kinase [Gammaproteobacteria bacterium]